MGYVAVIIKRGITANFGAAGLSSKKGDRWVAAFIQAPILGQ